MSKIQLSIDNTQTIVMWKEELQQFAAETHQRLDTIKKQLKINHCESSLKAGSNNQVKHVNLSPEAEQTTSRESTNSINRLDALKQRLAEKLSGTPHSIERPNN